DLFQVERTEANNEFRRMIWNDDQVWDLENVLLPAGQTYTSQPTVESIERPVRVSATFDEEGLIGTLDIPGVTRPSDGVILLERGFASVTFDEAKGFRVNAMDRLAEGQFIASDVLSDKQRRHQDFLRELFLENGDWEVLSPILFFWDDVRPVSVEIPGVENHVGAAFYSVPLPLRTPSPGTAVKIPQSLLSIRSGSDAAGEVASSVYSWRSGEWVDSKSYSTVYLRFRVPDSLIPLQLEGVNLSIDIQAEDRRVEFATVVDGELNPLQKVDSPREKFNFEIVDAKALELNSKNEWVFAIKIDRLVDQTDVAAWRVKDVKIEMSGKTP
ncbi:MAG: hypothetical protein VX904_07825, partial [Planctomycetota bacterium]|nr:hypothetical protein [Planctomycetota bacterium]